MRSDARDAFYVGYLAHMPPALARHLRPALGLLAGVVAVTALGLAAGHRRLPAARFEFAARVEVVGRISEGATPWLEVARPGRRPVSGGATGRVGALENRSRYLLVGPGKTGFDPLGPAFDGRVVRVKGNLAYRDGHTVLEVAVVETLPAGTELEADRDPPEPLGRFALEGEIVDSKCFFGVMNPGELKSHRACAVRCIAGGIPPTLCVRSPDGGAQYFLLVGPGGRAVNAEVLDLVAEPVRIEGDVVRHGDLLVLEADPTTYARLR